MANKYKNENELLKAAAAFDAENGRSQHVFYNPFKSANGVVEKGERALKFVKHELPKGYALDAESWDSSGQSGPARAYRIEVAVPKVKPCKTPGGCPDCPEVVDPIPPPSAEPAAQEVVPASVDPPAETKE